MIINEISTDMENDYNHEYIVDGAYLYIPLLLSCCVLIEVMTHSSELMSQASDMLPRLSMLAVPGLWVCVYHLKEVTRLMQGGALFYMIISQGNWIKRFSLTEKEYEKSIFASMLKPHEKVRDYATYLTYIHTAIYICGLVSNTSIASMWPISFRTLGIYQSEIKYLMIINFALAIKVFRDSGCVIPIWINQAKLGGVRQVVMLIKNKFVMIPSPQWFELTKDAALDRNIEEIKFLAGLRSSVKQYTLSDLGIDYKKTSLSLSVIRELLASGLVCQGPVIEKYADYMVGLNPPHPRLRLSKRLIRLNVILEKIL